MTTVCVVTGREIPGDSFPTSTVGGGGGTGVTICVDDGLCVSPFSSGVEHPTAELGQSCLKYVGGSVNASASVAVCEDVGGHQSRSCISTPSQQPSLTCFCVFLHLCPFACLVSLGACWDVFH